MCLCLGRLCCQARLIVWDLESVKVELTSDIPNPGFYRFSLLPTTDGEGIYVYMLSFEYELILTYILLCSVIQVSSDRKGLWEGMFSN